MVVILQTGPQTYGNPRMIGVSSLRTNAGLIHSSCSQNYGPLLVIDYIAAT